MHDFFDILGVPSTARPVDVRRVCARRVRRWHPDFGSAPHDEALSVPPPARDAAVDFAEMASFVDRIQTSFFRVPA